MYRVVLVLDQESSMNLLNIRFHFFFCPTSFGLEQDSHSVVNICWHELFDKRSDASGITLFVNNAESS